MRKIQYRKAIQIYMEVFDYLINTDSFVFKTDQEFLKSKITISESGFIKQVQSRKNIWDLKKDTIIVIPEIDVLEPLTKGIDSILETGVISESTNENYAYIHSPQQSQNKKVKYYQSYGEIFFLFKEIKKIEQTLEDTNNKVIDFNLIKLREFRNEILKLTSLEKKKIEYYARLEQELIEDTSNLLMVDEDGNLIPDFMKYLYFQNNPDYSIRLASPNTYIDWQKFKSCIIQSYISQSTEKKLRLY